MPVCERVGCPVCGGRGTCLDRRGRGHTCGLCDGSGHVTDDQVASMPDLRCQMQRVADAIQGGRDEDAASEARIALRLAKRMLQAFKG